MNKIKDQIVYSDGEFKNLADVRIYLNNQALNYGTGTFEGIRGYWDNQLNQLNLFRVKDHYARLIESAKVLKIDLGLTVDDLVEITIELIKKNNLKENIYVRPLALKKSLVPGGKFGVKLNGVDSTFGINVLPMSKYVNTDGISLMISSWQRLPNESIPSHAKITGSYVNSALAFEEACEHGFDDAVMLNVKGDCAEATTSNIFIIDNSVVKTPPVSAGILNGITRQSVIEMCSYLDIQCIEIDIDKHSLLESDECLLTGTGVEILPVIRVDGNIIGKSSGSISKKLINLFDEIKMNRSPYFSNWLTSVY